jgi:hypothetical protein
MIQQNCTTAVCNTLKVGGVIDPKDDAGGALSGFAHMPSELQEALDSGSLSSHVGAVVVFDPSYSISPSAAGGVSGFMEELASGFGATMFIDGIQMPY